MAQQTSVPDSGDFRRRILYVLFGLVVIGALVFFFRPKPMFLRAGQFQIEGAAKGGTLELTVLNPKTKAPQVILVKTAAGQTATDVTRAVVAEINRNPGAARLSASSAPQGNHFGVFVSMKVDQKAVQLATPKVGDSGLVVKRRGFLPGPVQVYTMDGVVAAATGTGTPTGTTGAAPTTGTGTQAVYVAKAGSRLDEYVPDTALAYVGVPDLREFQQRWRETHAARFLGNSDIVGLFGPIETLSGNLKSITDNFMVVTGTEFGAFLRLLQKDVAFAVTSLKADTTGLDLVFLAGLPADPEGRTACENALKKVFEKVRQSDPDKIESREMKAEGATGATLEDTQHRVKFSYALDSRDGNNVLIVTLGGLSAEYYIDVRKGKGGATLGKNALFAKVVGRVNTAVTEKSPPFLFAYASVTSIVQEMKKQFSTGGRKELASKVESGSLKAVGLSLAFPERGLLARCYLEVPASDASPFRSTAAMDPVALQLIPREAMNFFAARADLRGLYPEVSQSLIAKEWRKILSGGEGGPSRDQDASETLERLAKEVFKTAGDFLGDRMVAFTLAPERQENRTRYATALVLEVKGSQVKSVESALDGILKKLGKAGQPVKKFQAAPGVEGRIVPLPPGTYSTISAALTEKGYLVLCLGGPDDEDMRKVLGLVQKGMGGAPAPKDEGALARIRRVVPAEQAQFYFYQNADRVMLEDLLKGIPALKETRDRDNLVNELSTKFGGLFFGGSYSPDGQTLVVYQF